MKISNFTDLKSILFDNRTTKQTVLKNTFWVALADGISKISKLILIIYVARILGATEYGKFTFALAFVSLFVVFSDLGLSSIVTREFAREKGREKEFFSVISLKIFLSLITLILILVGSFFITVDPSIRKVIWILAVFVSISNFSIIINAFFMAYQRMEYQSWGVILEALMVTGAGFFVILKFPSIVNLSYSYLFSVLISLIFILVLFQFKIFPLGISWQKETWKRFLKMSWPLALATLFSTIYVYIDSVMMGCWGQITETGWYSAAYKVIISTGILMGIIDSGFYPALSKFFKESKEKFQMAWSYQMESMIILAVPLVVGGYVLAPKIIEFLYGKDFIPSILAFRILILMAGIIYLSRPFERALIVSNNQIKFFWITFLGAVIDVILNLILIPPFSLYGAAVATVISYLIMLSLFFYFTSKITPIKPLNLKLFFSSVIVGFSSIVMYFLISQSIIYNLNVFLSTAIGILVYVISFLIFKKITTPIYEKVEFYKIKN